MNTPNSKSSILQEHRLLENASRASSATPPPDSLPHFVEVVKQYMTDPDNQLNKLAFVKLFNAANKQANPLGFLETVMKLNPHTDATTVYDLGKTCFEEEARRIFKEYIEIPRRGNRSVKQKAIEAIRDFFADAVVGQEDLYIWFSEIARRMASSARDKDARCKEIERACRDLKKALFARFEHVGANSAQFAKHENASWDEELNADLKHLCALINMQIAIRAKTLKCQAGLSLNEDKNSFNQALHELFSQLLKTSDCNKVEMTVAFLELADAIQQNYYTKRKNFSIVKKSEYKCFLEQLNVSGEALTKSVIKQWEKKARFRSQPCYTPFFPFGVVYDLTYSDLGAVRGQAMRLQKHFQDQYHEAEAKHAKTLKKLKTAKKKKIPEYNARVAKYQARMDEASAAQEENTVSKLGREYRREILSTLLQMTSPNSKELTTSTVLEVVFFDLALKLKQGSPDAKVWAWLMAKQLEKKILLISNLTGQLRDYVGGPELLDAMQEVQDDGLITSHTLANNRDLLTPQFAERLCNAIPSQQQVRLFDHQQMLLDQTLHSFAEDERQLLINRSKTGYGKTAALAFWIKQMQALREKYPDLDIRMVYISSVQKLRDNAVNLAKTNHEIPWAKITAGILTLDWSSCGVFGHNDRMKTTESYKHQQAHKGGRRGHGKIKTQEARKKVIGITNSKRPLFFVADPSVDLSKLSPLNTRTTTKWMVMFDETSSTAQTSAQMIPEKNAEESLNQMSVDPEHFHLLRYIDSERRCMERLLQNPDVSVLTTCCATMLPSFVEYSRKLSLENNVECKDITSLGFQQHIDLQLPSGKILETERIAKNLEPRYIPMERAVKYLLDAPEISVDLGIYPVEPSVIYRLLVDNQDKMPIKKLTDEEINQLDDSPLTLENTKKALGEIKTPHVVQVLVTEQQADELSQLCLVDIVSKDDILESMAQFRSELNKEFDDREKEIAKVRKHMEQELKHKSISRAQRQDIVTQAQAAISEIGSNIFALAKYLSKKSPIGCWNPLKAQQVLNAMHDMDLYRHHESENILAAAGIHRHRDDKLSAYLIEQNLDIARLDTVNYWFGTDYAIGSQITPDGPCPQGLDRQRLGRIGRGHQGEARSIANLSTQLRRINPEASMGDIVFRTVASIPTDRYSRTAERSIKEQLIKERQDRCDEKQAEFNKKRALVEKKRIAKLRRKCSSAECIQRVYRCFKARVALFVKRDEFKNGVFTTVLHHDVHHSNDIQIKCAQRSCNTTFTLTQDDQKFYAGKNWNNPRRCEKCRAEGRKRRRNGGNRK